MIEIELINNLINKMENSFLKPTLDWDNKEVLAYNTEDLSYKYISNNFKIPKEENNIYDAYGSIIFEYFKKKYAFLNTYGQDDNWKDNNSKMDICLIDTQGNIFIGVLEYNNEISFYTGKITYPKYNILELGGKRAYSFIRDIEKNEFKFSIRYDYLPDNETHLYYDLAPLIPIKTHN